MCAFVSLFVINDIRLVGRENFIDSEKEEKRNMRVTQQFYNCE